MRSRRRNRSSASAGAIYLDREKALAALRRLALGAVERDPDITAVLLFGSLASGTATPRSDADLVVILRRAAPRRMDRVPPLLALFDPSPLPLDLHPYTEAEWEAARRRGDPFVRAVLCRSVDLLA